MRKTKVKFLVALAIAFLAIILANGKVFAAEDYTISYDETIYLQSNVTITFTKDVDMDDRAMWTWDALDSKTIRTTIYKQLSWQDVDIKMADGSTVTVRINPPAYLHDESVKIKPDFDSASQYTIENEEIAKFDEDNYIYGVKPGHTTISAIVDGEERVWDIFVSDFSDDDWTDTSDWEIELKNANNYTGYTLNINNFNIKQGHKYTLYMNNSDEGFFDESGVVNDTPYTLVDNNVFLSNEGKSSSIDKWLEKSGDIYIQVIESYIPNTGGRYISKVILKKTKLERPTYKLGARTYAYFFNDATSTYVYVPNKSTDRKMNIKIGKVSDVNILRSIKNQESDCMEKLLDYAKNSEHMFDGDVIIGRSESITGDLDLVQGEYYYVYTTLDDGDGEYFPIEDIGLYQAVVGDIVGKNLFSSLDSQFVWNLPETAEQTDDTTVIPTVEEQQGKKDGTEAQNLGPQAGEGLMAVVAIAVAGTIIFISYKKYNSIKIK